MPNEKIIINCNHLILLLMANEVDHANDVYRIIIKENKCNSILKLIKIFMLMKEKKVNF